MLITLRPVETSDLAAFYAMESDEVGRQMAAFGSPPAPEAAAYAERWERMLSNPGEVARSILADGQVAGYVLKFVMFGEDTVAYWVVRSHWGQGIATQALRLLLAEAPERPLYARAASDNLARAACWRSAVSSSSPKRPTSPKRAMPPLPKSSCASTRSAGPRFDLQC